MEKLSKQQEDSHDISKFIVRILKCTKLPELIDKAVSELIDKNTINKLTSTKHNRITQIKIFCNSVKN
ncbi:DUF4368 domain-containing protein [Streptococcus sanguinis]|uniref:DUF4368 domain-containing protein n=1 Tax=Streptococcus sanguinis TaxID=1305 RepID=UPI001CC11D7D|nr:DUF4368 domain-containing protein [Streptococcus sanguinis]